MVVIAALAGGAKKEEGRTARAKNAALRGRRTPEVPVIFF